MSLFMKPVNVLRVQEELKAYKNLCAQYNYSPAKDEFEDIVKFILLYHGGQGGAMLESNESVSDIDLNYLYETFMSSLSLEMLNEAAKGGNGEALEVDGEAEFDTAVGTVNTVVKKVGATLLVGAATAGLYIAFLFKRGKLKGSLAKEQALEMKKIDKFQEIVNLKVKLAELKDEEVPAISNIPTITPAPEMETPSRPGQK